MGPGNWALSFSANARGGGGGLRHKSRSEYRCNARIAA